MDNFFTYLKKSLIAVVFVIFGLVGTYVPHDLGGQSSVQTTEAVWWATFAGQIAELYESANTAISTTISAGYNAISSLKSQQAWLKEYMEDGIFWYLAKYIVSTMMRDLVNWINSGFQGRPLFLQNLQRRMLEVADQAAGEYFTSLVGDSSFLCHPFQVDIKIAVSAQYYNIDKYDQPAPDCSLVEMVEHIEDFMSGTQGSFSEGGWKDWFDITSKPEVYTPYGSTLAVQSGLRVQVLNAKNEQASILDFGSGFLSGEIWTSIRFNREIR